MFPIVLVGKGTEAKTQIYGYVSLITSRKKCALYKNLVDKDYVISKQDSKWSKDP